MEKYRVNVLGPHSSAEFGDGAKVWADSYVEVLAGICSDIKGYLNCTVKADDGSRIDFLDNATVHTGKSANVRIRNAGFVDSGEGTTISAGDDCTIFTGNGSVVLAGNNAVIEAGTDCIIRVRGGSVVIAGFGTKIIYDSFGLRDERIALCDGRRDDKKRKFEIRGGKILEVLE